MKKPKDLLRRYAIAISALKGFDIAVKLSGLSKGNITSHATNYRDYYNFLKANKDQAIACVCEYGIEQGVLTGSRSLHKLSHNETLSPSEAKQALDIAKALSSLKKDLKQAVSEPVRAATPGKSAADAL